MSEGLKNCPICKGPAGATIQTDEDWRIPTDRLQECASCDFCCTLENWNDLIRLAADRAEGEG